MMDNNIAVSVIVPAYNVGKFVQNCVESILSQTMRNIEIIAVDDGSTDNTREILLKLAESDRRVRVLPKDQNEGVSAARNSAIKIAKGEYVGFVDADDWVEKDAFEIMYKEGKNADLILAGYMHDAMDEARTKVNITRSVSMPQGYWDKKSEVVRMAASADSSKMFAYTWNKLYKREIISQNNLKFSKQTLIEDFVFNTQYWRYISTLSVISSEKYHYVKASKDALTQRFLPDFLDVMNKRFEHIKALMVEYDVYSGTTKELLANMYIKHAIAGVVRNCSPKANYSWGEQYKRAKVLLNDAHSKEAAQNAKATNKQEKICNLVFRTNTLFVLLMGKVIFMMQTKSKTAFDKLK